MKKLILVPMKRDDRVGDLLPYVEEVVRPGMKVLFMAPYPVEGFRCSHEESGWKAIAEGIRLADYYKWDTNRRKVNELWAPAMEALNAKGIEAVIELYAGSMRRAVREYAARGDIHLIVTRASFGNWVERIFDAAIAVVRSLVRPSFAPVMLVNPRRLA